MKMKDRTKIMFASELEKMLKNEAIDQVRVVDLCKRCGASAPTFYYYFKDKYDLAAWIYLSDISTAFGDREPEYSPERIEVSLDIMNTKREFYKKLFSDQSQNSILYYGMNYAMKIADDAVKAAEGKSMDEQQVLDTKHHAYGIFGLQQEWLFGQLDLSAKNLALFFYERTPDFLKNAFLTYNFHSEEIMSSAGTGR